MMKGTGRTENYFGMRCMTVTGLIFSIASLKERLKYEEVSKFKTLEFPFLVLSSDD